jgi:hypothetical protein
MVAQSPVNPVETWEKILVGPTRVSGKEYSAKVDKTATGEQKKGQTVLWAGDGTVRDGVNFYDYSSSGSSGNPYPEVDELANSRDMYFKDLVANRVSLVCSFTGYNKIYYHRPSHRINDYHETPSGIWAGSDQINKANPTEIDGLELWGPEGTPDANIYSQEADTNVDGQKVSILKYNDETGESIPYVYTSLIASHVINDAGNLVNPNVSLVDLDGLMLWDVNDDNSFGSGDQILFSLKPISGLFDGGEIWLYTYGAEKAEFLNMGGHIWNTDNNVQEVFGVTSEDITALEALPEPATLVLLILGGLALLRRKS